MKLDKRMTLPKPLGKYGYTEEQLRKICRRVTIPISDFWEAFGNGHTCAVGEHGESNFYECDVLHAFSDLGFKFYYKGD